jgi:hypothetical protein
MNSYIQLPHKIEAKLSAITASVCLFMMLFVRWCEGAQAWPGSGRSGRACGGARRVRHRLRA